MANFKDMFEGIEGPSDDELRALESEDFSPETIKGLQKMYGKIDPQYGRRLAERDRVRGVAPMSGATSRGRGESAATQDELVAGQGGILGGNTNSTDFDPADFRPAVGGSSVVSSGSSYFESHKDDPAYKTGVLYVRTAGPSCQHPRCKALRKRGYELMGLSGRIGGINEESSRGTVIPSVREDVEYTRPDKTTEFVAQYSPADKEHPLWKAAKASHRPDDLFDPSDLLEHHHYPGEDTGPLPFS